MRLAPWQVKGIGPHARETAREAARRSGMSVGQWLNAIILDQAADEGIHSEDDADRYDGHGDDLATINRRLDDLGRQIARLAGQPAAAPPRNPDAGARQIAEAILKLNSRLDTLIAEGRSASSALGQRMNSVDQALAKLKGERVRAAASYSDGKPVSISVEQASAEIAARQRALDAEFGASPAATVERPAPLQCRTSEAVDSLREELAEIARTLADAMPRRAVEALEGEVRALAQRLDAERGAGGEAPAVAGLEQGLHEVRDALHRLAPAESLVGFDQAIKIMSNKIDVIAGARQNPAGMEQLEAATAALRTLVGQVATSDALAALAKEVRALADRIERGVFSGGADAFAALERRIGTIADAIEAVRDQSGRNPAPQLDRLMSALDEKLGRLEAVAGPLPHGDQQASGGLENRIGQLMNKLEASEGRLGRLDTIEHGMSELLAHLDALRAAKANPADTPAPISAPMAVPTSAPMPGPAVLPAQSTVEPHTREPLENVQGPIETVIGPRVATTRSEPRIAAPVPLEGTAPAAAPSIPQSAPPPGAPVHPPGSPAPASQPAAAVRPPSAPRPPIDPSLPADHPLEPGSGPPRSRTGASTPAKVANAAERIAASEAPLRANGVVGEPEPKANYLQAARRAAQLAQMSQRAEESLSAEPRKLVGRLSSRRKALLVGLSAAVLIVAALRFAASYFQLAELVSPPAPAVAENEPAVMFARPSSPAPRADAPLFLEPDVTAATPPTPSPAERSAPPAIVIVPPVATVAPPSSLPAPQPVPGPPPSAAAADTPSLPSLVAAPLPASIAVAPLPAPAAAPVAALPTSPPATDVTGAIAPRQAAAGPAAAPLAPASADQLPAGIGGRVLIAAATAGEPAAAYEVATRFAEGRGVPRSFAQAAVWYERAAKTGLAPALFRLGALYEKGEGVTKDLNEARRLYIAAADKGNVNAMHNIGVLYSEGIDGKPDFKVAAQWFRRSAMFGIGDSQYNLAVLYARGLGVGRDMAEAYRWFALAAKAGDADAGKKRDDVAARLDPNTLATARHDVETWVAQQAPNEASTVQPPPGGWDQAPPAAKRKSRAGQHVAKAASI
jgi:localization factor PodJL